MPLKFKARVWQVMVATTVTQNLLATTTTMTHPITTTPTITTATTRGKERLVMLLPKLSRKKVKNPRLDHFVLWRRVVRLLAFHVKLFANDSWGRILRIIKWTCQVSVHRKRQSMDLFSTSSNASVKSPCLRVILFYLPSCLLVDLMCSIGLVPKWLHVTFYSLTLMLKVN